MLGEKTLTLTPTPFVSLDELVPTNHFYRRLERALDLSFVRDLVRCFYAVGGRPSIDPVVFFKLQLVMFFEGIRSERQLLVHAADWLSVRWYLGYALHEPLPDHSSLTRIRDRYGVTVFRQFFEAILQRCIAAGLVGGRSVFADATKVEANASTDTLLSAALNASMNGVPKPVSPVLPSVRECVQASRRSVRSCSTVRVSAKLVLKPSRTEPISSLLRSSFIGSAPYDM